MKSTHISSYIVLIGVAFLWLSLPDDAHGKFLLYICNTNVIILYIVIFIFFYFCDFHNCKMFTSFDLEYFVIYLRELRQTA